MQQREIMVEKRAICSPAAASSGVAGTLTFVCVADLNRVIIGTKTHSNPAVSGLFTEHSSDCEFSPFQ